ncbi:MAG: hypothetical protein CK424_05380 [Legionella sp.]|nr:MAG: hypothetical protein CK424_05380 [Legionella sp.]
MKKIQVVLLSMALSVVSLPSYSDDTPIADDTLTQYVKVLGEYLGYDLETGVTPVEAMLSYTASWAKTGQQILNVFFAAIPVNAAYDEFLTNSSYDSFNKQANILFANFKSPNAGDVSVVKDFDQATYQGDPVSQAILNLLGTPNTSICPDDDSCLSENKVMNTVLQDIMASDKNKGSLPGETQYFSYDNSSQFLSQLNVNTLIAPLIYSTTDEGGANGLPSSNQQQQAMDFVRYATSGVIPLETMLGSDYSALWNQARQSPEGQDQTTINAIKNAQKDLATYLLSLRVYAAQSSVAISNLYQIMAKRMPVTSKSSDGASSSTTSQAFNEFQSATWRLYNPTKTSSGDQWTEQINTASSATLQKEIAILLSEINYQLYLNRQQEERILLTNSLSLLQLMNSNKPSTVPITSAGATTTTAQ